MLPLIPLEAASSVTFGWKLVLVAFLGFAIGYMGAVMGLVLGVLRLPVIYILGLPAATAAGTNIGISAMGALAGSWRHLRDGRVNLRIVFYMGIPSLIGAFAGGLFSRLISTWFLLMIVGIILLWQGSTMVREGIAGRRNQSQTNPNQPQAALNPGTSERRALQAGIGLSVGLLGGMVGLILGSLRLPTMIRFLRVDPRMAIGTNMAVGLLTGIFGFGGHLVGLKIDWGVLVVMGPAAMVGAYYGAHQTGRFKPETLKLALGVLLVILSGVMFREVFL